ncbi:aminodeoxychorismate synthase component I [Prevotella cerevisiae]|uniref:Aminodeoxychorismate synthase component I n=1 Tax=Segatella cerevisiae TaxID=2053716 RepID=A0ABT1BZB0_9BACT|nr:aminodeoxychorismate synthase component I [Segatella cerevisiae]MCO6025742.1 aminodeoxychorismate synthase component I [Segatella cerevisiae]
MNILSKNLAIRKMNELGGRHQPFVFIISYDQNQCIVLQPEEVDPKELLYHLGPFSNEPPQFTGLQTKSLEWKIYPPTFEQYRKAFDHVRQNELKGNSYLANLTGCTRVKTNMTLQEIFRISKAKYKVWLKQQFTVFSPETFVQIKGRKIYSFPMKGTIDAAIPNAAHHLLNDPKEKAEHATITDLIRNDLSKIAEHVTVERYRYIETIKTHSHTLLATSSCISGVLPSGYYTQIGDLFFSLLPAGSITGAPKDKTAEIIHEAEQYERHFYTGVTGYFDGQDLDSGVMIRFVEQEVDGSMVFKSGGGITVRSNCAKEYLELKQKADVPIYRNTEDRG